MLRALRGAVCGDAFPFNQTFEQKGLISLKNLIALTIALGYVSEIRNLFSQPKYDTMEELTQIRKNSKKKRAYK